MQNLVAGLCGIFLTDGMTMQPGKDNTLTNTVTSTAKSRSFGSPPFQLEFSTTLIFHKKLFITGYACTFAPAFSMYFST